MLAEAGFASKADLAAFGTRLETTIAKAKFATLVSLVPLLAAQVVALIGLYFKG